MELVIHNKKNVPLSYVNNREWLIDQHHIQKKSITKISEELGIDQTTLCRYYRKGYQLLESRIKYQKHKLLKLLKAFSPSLTEWENMKNNGYDRIWDCGNDVWIWNKL